MFNSFLRGLLKSALPLTLMCNVSNATAQTTLAAGDLLFTAFDSQPGISATEAPFDRVSFVALKKINANTIIYFTDLGYKNNTWFTANNNTEGVVKLTTSGTIELGEEVLLILTPGKYAATLGGNSIGLLEASNSPRLSMGNSGDQLFAFQGGNGLPGGSGAVLITGIHWNAVQSGSANNYTLISNDSGWDNLTAAGHPQSTLSTTNSDIPPSLTAGQNAFYLGSIPAANGYHDYVTAAAFNGTGKPYANAAAIRTAVMNRANWSRKISSTPGTYTIPTGHFLAISNAPTVSSVSSTTANGTYKVGDVISIQVNFSMAVNVIGTPQLTLETGTTDRTINYATGSGSSTLTFNYTVQTGDISADLDYTSTTALSLNGGSIMDAANNAAVLTLSAPGTANALGANKAIVVDGIPPTVTITSSAGTNGSNTSATTIPVTVTFSETVSNFIAGDIMVSNGNISNFNGSGNSYTFSITGMSSGTVAVNIAANRANDAAGNGNTAATQFSITYLQPLPVLLTSYTATAAGNTVKLAWVTESEQRNHHFKLLRASDGLNFTSIGTVLGNGTTSTKKNYHFYDRSPLTGTSYYQLIQVDNDGKNNELGIKTVVFNLATNSLSIYPNPVAKKVMVNFNLGTTRLEIADLSGKIVVRKLVKPNDSSLEINLQQLAKGTYVLRALTAKGTATTKLIKL